MLTLMRLNPTLNNYYDSELINSDSAVSAPLRVFRWMKVEDDGRRRFKSRGEMHNSLRAVFSQASGMRECHGKQIFGQELS